jgi:hypothetical protein
VEGCGCLEEPPDFCNTEDGRKTVFGVGAHARQGVPVALEDVLGAEPHTTGADTQGRGGEVVDVFAVQEGVLECGCGEEVGGCAIALREHTDFTDRGFLSPFACAAEVERGEHLLTQRGHEISPFLS